MPINITSVIAAITVFLFEVLVILFRGNTYSIAVIKRFKHGSITHLYYRYAKYKANKAQKQCANYDIRPLSFFMLWMGFAECHRQITMGQEKKEKSTKDSQRSAKKCTKR